jgi:TolB protein
MKVVGLLAAVALTGGAANGAASRPPSAFPGANGLIAFERESPAGNHTQADLFTMGPGGRSLVRLTCTPQRNEFGPSWNAAGTQLAFWRTRAPFGPGSVWVMRPDGTGQRRLTRGIDARDPAWNPAGTRLVFTRADGPGFDLWTMRGSDGRGRRQLTSGRALDFEPAWSPDGSRIAFTRGFAQGDVGDIYVLRLAGGAITRVTHTRAYDHQVAWSPDGSRLVFERDRDRSSSIYTVRPDGTGLRRLTTGAFFDVAPAWSPDGRWIVFGSDRGGSLLDDLWVMRSDGSRLHRLRHLRFSEGAPDWQPLPGTSAR